MIFSDCPLTAYRLPLTIIFAHDHPIYWPNSGD
jgi:hypothetical protein